VSIWSDITGGIGQGLSKGLSQGIQQKLAPQKFIGPAVAGAGAVLRNPTVIGAGIGAAATMLFGGGGC